MYGNIFDDSRLVLYFITDQNTPLKTFTEAKGVVTNLCLSLSLSLSLSLLKKARNIWMTMH